MTSADARLRPIPKTVSAAAAGDDDGIAGAANVGDVCPAALFPTTKMDIESMGQDDID